VVVKQIEARKPDFQASAHPAIPPYWSSGQTRRLSTDGQSILTTTA
jgi:hypothetical protein